jgi:hypothetical protein
MIVLMSEAYGRGASWQEDAAGLAALLAFLDSEPLLARVCLVEALAAARLRLSTARELQLLMHMVDAALARGSWRPPELAVDRRGGGGLGGRDSPRPTDHW